MSETYAEIEERINQAIVALKTRKNVSRNKITEEFRVPVQRLWSRLTGNATASSVWGLHLRKHAPDQEKALRDYFIQLDKSSIWSFQVYLLW